MIGQCIYILNDFNDYGVCKVGLGADPTVRANALNKNSPYEAHPHGHDWRVFAVVDQFTFDSGLDYAYHNNREHAPRVEKIWLNYMKDHRLYPDGTRHIQGYTEIFNMKADEALALFEKEHSGRLNFIVGESDIKKAKTSVRHAVALKKVVIPKTTNLTSVDCAVNSLKIQIRKEIEAELRISIRKEIIKEMSRKLLTLE